MDASILQQKVKIGSYGTYTIEQIKRMEKDREYANQIYNSHIKQQTDIYTEMYKTDFESAKALNEKINHIEGRGIDEFVRVLSESCPDPQKIEEARRNNNNQTSTETKTQTSTQTSSAENSGRRIVNPTINTSSSENRNSSFGNPTLNNQNNRSASSTNNLYTNDKLKAAQYAYDAKMHTPSSLLKLNTNVSLAGVVGSTFGHATKNIATAGVRLGINALKEGTVMGAGAIAQDEGTRKSMEAVKYTAMATTAIVGDVSHIARSTSKNIAAAASQVAGLERFQLSSLNKNVLTKHFGKSNILGMTDKEVSLGCLSYLNNNGVKISEDILHGNAAFSIKKINGLLKGTSDKEVQMVLNALKGNILKKTFKPDFSMPKFQLLNIGISLAGNMKYKLLSHDELEGLNILANIKDKGTAIARNTIKFFQNVKNSVQKAAALGRKGLLQLKRTKLFDKIYKNGLSKITKKVSRTVAKKAGVKAGRYAHKFTETAIRKSLREAMRSMMRNLMAKTIGKITAKIVATKVGGFIAKKVGESALVGFLADFAAKWVPVVGQIYFVVEIVVVIIVVILVVIMATSVKTVIDDIGNIGAYPSESISFYASEMDRASREYKLYFDAVQNRDSNGKLLHGKGVPKIVTKLTDNINIGFTDYMAVDSYDESSVNTEAIRMQYGNQPEILNLIHVMSDFGLYDYSEEVKNKYGAQARALYYKSHIMYITYYQTPYSKKNNVDITNEDNFDDVYSWIWDADNQYYKINEKEEDVYDDNTGDLIGTELVPIVVGKVPKKPASMNVKWNSDVTFDVYYLDDLFDISSEIGDNTDFYTNPQVYIKYTRGYDAFCSSDSLPASVNMKDKAITECMSKVYQAVSKKLDEKGISNADPGAITAGIVANLISEGACRANNYEDSWQTEKHLSDEQVTEIYNYYLSKGKEAGDDINVVKDLYDKGIGADGNKLSCGVVEGGYGICQWTDYDRKMNLFTHAMLWNDGEGTTIDDLDMQIDFMLFEMEGKGYFNENTDPGKVFAHGNASSIAAYLCLNFEIPADKEKRSKHRAKVASTLYNGYDGVLSDIDYDDEHMNDYVDFIKRKDYIDESGLRTYDPNSGLKLSSNWYVMGPFYPTDGDWSATDYHHNSDIMIKEYLESQNYRPAPETGDVLAGTGHLVTHIYHGCYNYFKSKDFSNIESGDMIVWNDFAAIYIGNGKVLCCQSISPESNEEPIGKFLLTDVVKVMGNDYQVVAPIKDIEETEETQEN